MTNKETETLREEFEKEFPLISAGCDGCHSSQKYQVEVMNWWIAKLLASREEVKRKYQDALIWCSGSDDFQIGGKAREGWEKICLPLLKP